MIKLLVILSIVLDTFGDNIPQFLRSFTRDGRKRKHVRKVDVKLVGYRGKTLFSLGGFQFVDLGQHDLHGEFAVNEVIQHHLVILGRGMTAVDEHYHQPQIALL